MQITVKFVGALRHASGKTELNINALNVCSVKDLVDELSREIPHIKKSLIDQQTENPKPNTLILINGKEISVLQGLDSKLQDDDEVVFVPVVHGG